MKMKDILLIVAIAMFILIIAWLFQPVEIKKLPVIQTTPQKYEFNKEGRTEGQYY